MLLLTRWLHLARLAFVPVCALALAGCLGLGGGSEPATTATTEAAERLGRPGEEQIDIRRFLGPDYCPEIRIPEGSEVIRRYERGHEDDADFVVWQASIGKTARECLYDAAGRAAARASACPAG